MQGTKLTKFSLFILSLNLCNKHEYNLKLEGKKIINRKGKRNKFRPTNVVEWSLHVSEKT